MVIEFPMSDMTHRGKEQFFVLKHVNAFSQAENELKYNICVRHFYPIVFVVRTKIA